MQARRSTHTLLELLLPAGRARSALVLGSACPPRLLPGTGSAEGADGAEAAGGAAETGPADLVVIAPGLSESADPEWLSRAVVTCAERLTDDGLAYVLLPPRRRRAGTALLRGHGLLLEPPILHLPDTEESRHLVPLERKAAGYALRRIVPLVAFKRAAIAALLAGRGAGLLAMTQAPVALLARPEGAPSLFAWLQALAGVKDGAAGHTVVTASWRPAGPRVVLHLFPGEGVPLVAKVALDGASEVAVEAVRLAELGSAAELAGASVPRLLRSGDIGGSEVLLETRVDGQVLAPGLSRRPALLEPALRRVCAWLGRWQELTATREPLSRARLEREVLGPARELALGHAYLRALSDRCGAVEGIPAPLTASHNDLTMWNVLVDGRDGLGVVDWEVAEGATLPLRDFPYAVVDAVAATGRYGDRLGAYRRCFEAGGDRVALVLSLQEPLLAALDVPREAVDLAYHACWLGHAVNEARTAAPGDPMPFGAIARRLAESKVR